MTRNEAMRLAKQAETLQALGFTADEAKSLRRISMTLRRWIHAEPWAGRLNQPCMYCSASPQGRFE